MKKALFALLLVSLSKASTTGFVTGLTSDAINDFKDSALPFILSQAEDTEIPSQTYHVGHGRFKVLLMASNIKVSALELDVEKTKVEFSEPDRISLTIAGISGESSLDWSYDSALAGDQGSASIDLLETTAAMDVKLQEDQGKIVVEIENMVLSIRDLKIQILNNPSADLANWVLSVFNDKLKDLIEESVSGNLKETFQRELNKIIGTYPSIINIGETPLAVNYSLSTPPKVTDQYLQINSLGLFLNKDKPELNPPIPAPKELPDFNPDSKDIQSFVSDYTINSAFYSAFTAGLLQANITSESVPSISPIQLTTSSLDNIIPGLVKKYGKNKKVDLACEAQKSPVISLQADESHGLIKGEIDTACGVIVRDEGQAVVLDMVLDFNGTAYLKDSFLKGSLKGMEITQLEARDNVLDKPVDTQGMMDLFNMAIELVLPSLDTLIFGKGIPLPKIDYVDLTDSEVVIKDGYVYVQATPHYNFN